MQNSARHNLCKVAIAYCESSFVHTHGWRSSNWTHLYRASNTCFLVIKRCMGMWIHASTLSPLAWLGSRTKFPILWIQLYRFYSSGNSSIQKDQAVPDKQFPMGSHMLAVQNGHRFYIYIFFNIESIWKYSTQIQKVWWLFSFRILSKYFVGSSQNFPNITDEITFLYLVVVVFSYMWMCC